MIHLTTATPDRFSALAASPRDDLARLHATIERGRVDPAHLLVATDASGDAGRVGLYRAGDGTMLTYAWRVREDCADAHSVYRMLAGGIADLARRHGLVPALSVVIDADEDNPSAKRRALLATGWEVEDDRLELSTPARKRPWAPGIEQISPFDDAVTEVMSAAMAISADTYDVEQVRALGPLRAARAYRDMMADGVSDPVWLAHRGSDGIDGIAAIQRHRSDWSLGYLGVRPQSRGQGVGRALATAMISATADAGIGHVTASVAVGNGAIRATLAGAGFTTRSQRTDFEIRPA